MRVQLDEIWNYSALNAHVPGTVSCSVPLKAPKQFALRPVLPRTLR